MVEETGPNEVLRPPPPGYRLSKGRGPFTSHNGPYYFRQIEAGAAQGFWALDRHCNGFGILHGGMIAAFTDGLLAHAVARSAGRTGVTVQLSMNYLSAGREGEWIEGMSHMTHHAGDVAFAEARIFCGERDIARATAVFKLMTRRET